MRSGRIVFYPGVNTLGLSGEGSDYWSICASPNAVIVYFLGFGKNSVGPSNDHYARYSGFSLRCLAS